MSVIRTAFPQSEVQSLDALRIDRLRLNPSDRDVTNLQIIRGGPVVAGINVPTADLLAALDATANTDVAGMRRDLIVAENAADEWKARAEGAEAERDEYRMAAEAEAEGLNEWQARAEKAEAALSRVEDVLTNGDIIFGESVEAAFIKALHPKPAFALPTEAGAVVEYTDHHGSTHRWFRTRDTQRPWVDREGNTWHDAGLARDIAGDFTVLIGADQ